MISTYFLGLFYDTYMNILSFSKSNAVSINTTVYIVLLEHMVYDFIYLGHLKYRGVCICTVNNILKGQLLCSSVD